MLCTVSGVGLWEEQSGRLRPTCGALGSGRDPKCFKDASLCPVRSLVCVGDHGMVPGGRNQCLAPTWSRRQFLLYRASAWTGPELETSVFLKRLHLPLPTYDENPHHTSGAFSKEPRDLRKLSGAPAPGDLPRSRTGTVHSPADSPVLT